MTSCSATARLSSGPIWVSSCRPTAARPGPGSGRPFHTRRSWICISGPTDGSMPRRMDAASGRSSSRRAFMGEGAGFPGATADEAPPGSPADRPGGADFVAHAEASQIADALADRDAMAAESWSVAELPRAAVHLHAAGAVAEPAECRGRVAHRKRSAAEAGVVEEDETRTGLRRREVVVASSSAPALVADAAPRR